MAKQQKENGTADQWTAEVLSLFRLLTNEQQDEMIDLLVAMNAGPTAEKDVRGD